MKTTSVVIPALLIGVSACGGDPSAPVIDLPEDADAAHVRIIIPEAWELANVITALTTYGINDPNLIWKSGEYYRQVRSAFDAYRTHSSMESLQLTGSDPIRRYYEFRENSIPYGLQDGRLVHGRRYGRIWQRDRFTENLESVQAFADAAHFDEFYRAHAAYYAETIERYRSVVQVDTMIDWLEREFGRRYDCYTVAFSPLIQSSHSAWSGRTTCGSEAVMFVAGPDVEGPATLPEQVRHAIVQRILFTEVDHLFVNPVTDRYGSQIDAAFAERAKWTTDQSSFYSSPRAVFNEYMTWAVLFLYLDGRMPGAEFDQFMDLTNRLMENTRRFTRFGAFNRELLRLWRARAPGTSVSDLYPAIAQWAAGVKPGA